MNTADALKTIREKHLKIAEDNRNYVQPERFYGSIKGLTDRFEKTEFKDTVVWNKVKDVKDKLMYFVYGVRGNGKTFAVQGMARKLYEGDKNLKILYTTMIDILMELESIDFDKRKKYIEELIKYHVLIIDEIDKFKLTEYKEQVVFYILDKRLSKMRKTIITSNLDDKALGEKIGQNIMSRILDDCIKIHSDGSVLR